MSEKHAKEAYGDPIKDLARFLATYIPMVTAPVGHYRLFIPPPPFPTDATFVQLEEAASLASLLEHTLYPFFVFTSSGSKHFANEQSASFMLRHLINVTSYRSDLYQDKVLNSFRKRLLLHCTALFTHTQPDWVPWDTMSYGSAAEITSSQLTSNKLQSRIEVLTVQQQLENQQVELLSKMWALLTQPGVATVPVIVEGMASDDNEDDNEDEDDSQEPHSIVQWHLPETVFRAMSRLQKVSVLSPCPHASHRVQLRFGSADPRPPLCRCSAQASSPSQPP